MPGQRQRPTPGQRPYRPYGAALELLYARDAECVLDGPAGTGKSRGALEKLHIAASKYAGMRGLMVRKTRASLTQTAMVTFERHVLPAASPVHFHTGAQEYRYPNGSVLVVGGMDKPIKVMSAEYDLAYVQEATELLEGDWESLTTRLRNGVMPYQQLYGDVNPVAPTHWLNQRANRGTTRRLLSRHEDNPVLWDAARGVWTLRGAAYIATLDALTGVRKLRLRYGRWAAADGQVYGDWDAAIHLLSGADLVARGWLPAPDPLPPPDAPPSAYIPASWPRWRAIDFGYTNPFVCAWYAEDPDGRLYRYRELYGTGRLVEDWATAIRALSGEEHYVGAAICDHDAEDRATLTRHGIPTTAARKDVSPGIQAVQARLRPAGDGRPRLVFLRDALVARDPTLAEKHRPCCTEDEMDSYVWEKSGDGKPQKEVPHKEDDHGLDVCRYLVAHRDFVGRPVDYGRERLWR